MTTAMKLLEKKVGPVTVGMLLRAHRTRNDLSQLELAQILNATVGFISNIETGKKHISLEKTLDIAKKIGSSKEFFASIWFQEEARINGLSFEKIIKAKSA